MVWMKHRDYEFDDEDVDERGVVRDGGRVHVPLMDGAFCGSKPSAALASARTGEAHRRANRCSGASALGEICAHFQRLESAVAAIGRRY